MLLIKRVFKCDLLLFVFVSICMEKEKVWCKPNVDLTTASPGSVQVLWTREPDPVGETDDDEMFTIKPRFGKNSNPKKSDLTTPTPSTLPPKTVNNVKTFYVLGIPISEPNNKGMSIYNSHNINIKNNTDSKDIPTEAPVFKPVVTESGSQTSIKEESHQRTVSTQSSKSSQSPSSTTTTITITTKSQKLSHQPETELQDTKAVTTSGTSDPVITQEFITIPPFTIMEKTDNDNSKTNLPSTTIPPIVINMGNLTIIKTTTNSTIGNSTKLAGKKKKGTKNHKNDEDDLEPEEILELAQIEESKTKPQTVDPLNFQNFPTIKPLNFQSFVSFLNPFRLQKFGRYG